MRKILSALAALVFALALSGCAGTADGVRLASDSKMLDRCRDAYGMCGIVSHVDGENSKIYTMVDEEKGFLYTAETYAKGAWLDTTLGYYEDWRSDFAAKYMDLFLEENAGAISGISASYGVSFGFNCYVWLAEASGDDPDACVAAASELGKLLAGWDGRGYWGPFEIRIVVSGEGHGVWRNGTGYVSSEDELAEWFMTVAASEIGTTAGDLEFLRLEFVPCAGLDGYSGIRDRLMNILGSDNATKTETYIAWFKYKNREYWIADLCWQDDMMHTRHLGNFPSRYG